MEFDLSIFSITVLLSIGLIAGCLNTLAGGGSLITLPALIALGLPADIANATNRLGIFAQSITGAKGFDYYGRLDRGAIISLSGPIVIGSILGALIASYMPVWLLEPILLSLLVTPTRRQNSFIEAAVNPLLRRPEIVGSRGSLHPSTIPWSTN